MEGRVLIFDDDIDLLEVCDIVLKSKNYLVNGINRIIDVVTEVVSYAPDVILMDNWIPDPGGIKATQQLKVDIRSRDIPVIFFSANSMISELAAEAGADFFLQKPFEIDELEDVVSKAVAKRRSLITL